MPYNINTVERMPVYKAIRHGNLRYIVRLPRAWNAGRQSIRTFAREEDARVFADQCLSRRGTALERFNTLPPIEQAKVAVSLELLDWDINRFDQIVRQELNRRKLMHSRTISKAVTEFLLAKEMAGKSKEYISMLKSTLMTFANSKTGMQMAFITADHVRRHVWENNWKNSSRRTRWVEFCTFFDWCLKRGYVTHNIVKDVECPVAEKTVTQCLSVDDAKRLLELAQAVDPDILCHLSIMLFAGLRPTEASRVTWFDMKDGHIRIIPTLAKTRRNRWVTINATLAEFLKRPGPLPCPQFQERLKALRDKLQIPWQNDILRHTFVSYSIPMLGMTQTALEAGHSESVLIEHYRKLATKADAERFWAIRPQSFKS